MQKFYDNIFANARQYGKTEMMQIYTDQLVKKYFEEVERALIDTLTVKLGYAPTKENFRGRIHQVYCHLTGTTTYNYDNTLLFCLTESGEMGKIGWKITKFY
jgi:hypothetical protein